MPTSVNSTTKVDSIMGEVRDLKSVADALNKESDDLQQILATLNAKLAALKIGLEVWLNVPFCLGDDEWDDRQDESTGYRHAWMLGYTKLKDGWSIAVRGIVARNFTSECPDIRNDYSDPIPVLNAPRDVRIEAAERIGDLIDEIKAEAERGVKAIQSARKIAEKL